MSRLIAKTDVTYALGYSPYDASNPLGFSTLVQMTSALTGYATLTSVAAQIVAVRASFPVFPLLATVATSGLYSDLSGRPPLGAPLSSPAFTTGISVSGTASPGVPSVGVSVPNGSFAPLSYKNHAGLDGSPSAARYDPLTWPVGFAFDYTRIAADQLSANPDMAGRSPVIGQAVVHNFGGGMASGARIAQFAMATMQAPMDPTKPDAYAVAHWGFARGLVNNGGTAAVPRGFLCAYNPQFIIGSGATWWSVAEGIEVDCEVAAGGSVNHKIGVNVTTIGNDAVHGTTRDTALHIGAVSSSNGWMMGLQFSDFSGGGKPINSQGTLIGSLGNVGTVKDGIDLRGFTFTGNPFLSNGFAVNPFGTILTPGLASATSLSFNTPGGKQVQVIDIPNVVNLVQLYGGAAGGVPTVTVEGAEADITLGISAKGNGSILLTSKVYAPQGISVLLSGQVRLLEMGPPDSGGVGYRMVRVAN